MVGRDSEIATVEIIREGERQRSYGPRVKIVGYAERADGKSWTRLLVERDRLNDLRAALRTDPTVCSFLSR